jgi:hypothetical protein
MILIGFYRCALTVLLIYHLGGEHSPVAPPVTSWQLNVNPRVNRHHPPLPRRSTLGRQAGGPVGLRWVYLALQARGLLAVLPLVIL